MVCEDEAFGRLAGLEEVMKVGPSWWDYCICRRHQRFLSLLFHFSLFPSFLFLPFSLSFYYARIKSEGKPGRNSHQNSTIQMPLFELPVSRMVRNKFLLFKTPSICILLWQPVLIHGLYTNIRCYQMLQSTQTIIVKIYCKKQVKLY